MKRDPPDAAHGLVLEGEPPGSGRPSWLALIVSVVVALLVGSVIGYGVGAGPDANSTLGAAPSLTEGPSPTTSPSATAPALRELGGEPPMGLLTAGTYTHSEVDGTIFNAAFTVPPGWTWNGRYLSKGGIGPPQGAAIFFFGGPVQVYADPCQWAAAQSQRRTGPTAFDLMLALTLQSGRNASEPTDRTAKNRAYDQRFPGKAIELTVPDGVRFADCDQGQFRSWGPETKARSHQAPGQRDLVWAVDVGVDANGPERLIIDAASFPNTPANVQSEMELVLESIVTGHWG